MTAAKVPMRKKSAYFLLTVIAALAVLFGMRQRTLNALRADNDSLRKQVDSEKTARAVVVLQPPAAPVPKLNDADEKELLQLRSKIVPLREQLRDTSNRVVVLQKPLPLPEARQVRPAAPKQSFTWDGTQWIGDSNRIAQLLNADTGPDGRLRISIKPNQSNSPPAVP